MLDDAAAGAVGPEVGGERQQLHQPVHDVRLELGAHRPGRPQHALHAEPGRDQLAEDARTAAVGREVRVPARVLPVGGGRHHDPVEVGDDRVPALALLGGRDRQHRADVAGLHGRHRPAAPRRAPCRRRPTRSARARRRGTRRASCAATSSRSDEHRLDALAELRGEQPVPVLDELGVAELPARLAEGDQALEPAVRVRFGVVASAVGSPSNASRWSRSMSRSRATCSSTSGISTSQSCTSPSTSCSQVASFCSCLPGGPNAKPTISST